MQIVVVTLMGLLSAVPADRDGPARSSLPQWVATAASAVAPQDRPGDAANRKPSPEERMNARHPQPIKVADLIGLPVLDYSDSTIGYVRKVVRTPGGKIELIVTQGGWPAGWSTWRSRLVAVPIELVAILGRQLAALEMTRDQFVAAPTWSEGDVETVPLDDSIRIAITRR